jgi:3-hydroxyacyl-CoA dehydrogenase/enoyl-CoA hydratase/3-hydroxybutyryl-CoA epimerase
MTSTLDQPEKKVAAREAAEAVPRSPAMAALIRSEITEDQICILTFDRPDSAANIFDRATLEELHRHIDAIGGNARLRGVIVTSAKKSIFIAGADLHSISQFTEPAQLDELIRLGQTAFHRLAHLSIPTIAAIHGACVGGGYEICLACNYRIASSDRATKIGGSPRVSV